MSSMFKLNLNTLCEYNCIEQKTFARKINNNHPLDKKNLEKLKSVYCAHFC